MHNQTQKLTISIGGVNMNDEKNHHVMTSLYEVIPTFAHMWRRHEVTMTLHEDVITRHCCFVKGRPIMEAVQNHVMHTKRLEGVGAGSKHPLRRKRRPSSRLRRLHKGPCGLYSVLNNQGTAAAVARVLLEYLPSHMEPAQCHCKVRCAEYGTISCIKWRT